MRRLIITSHFLVIFNHFDRGNPMQKKISRKNQKKIFSNFFSNFFSNSSDNQFEMDEQNCTNENIDHNNATNSTTIYSDDIPI